MTEYASKAGSLAAHLTTVVQEAGKIFAALPLEISKFSASKEKEVVSPVTVTYSTTDKSYSRVYVDGASTCLRAISVPI